MSNRSTCTSPTARTATLAIALAVSLTAAAARADEPDARDLTVEQTAVFAVQAPAPAASVTNALKVSAWVDHNDNTYGVGEVVRLFVKSSKAAYVTVLNVGPSGRTTVLFPNQFQSDNRIAAGQIIEVPNPKSSASIKVSGPVGAELIKVVASTTPVVLFEPGQLAAAGPFRSIEKPSAGVARDLQVTMSQPTAAPAAATPATGPIEWASYNKVIRTVVRQAAAPAVAPVLVPVTPAPAAVAPAAVAPAGTWPAQAFKLEVATDKPVYRVGEAITVFVRSQQACRLTIVNIGAGGVARILFPNRLQPANQIAAGQTYSLPGTPAVALVATGPVGSESVIAICETGPASRFAQGVDLTQTLFPRIGNATTVSRDLAVVSTRPDAAQATVGFVVTN